MISKDNFTKEHIEDLRLQNNNAPSLLEKSVYAFGLLEAIQRVGMPFIFKGGTSLLLILDKPMRLSTDIDIIVPPGTDVDHYIAEAGRIFPFLHSEEDVRIGRNKIEKRHYKFFYQSPLTGKEFSILLDVVFEENPYNTVTDHPIQNDLLMITAAFEWEYSNLYPNGFPKKKRVLNAEEAARKTIDIIIEQKKNDNADKKELEIYYNFRDEIGSFDSLESKIMHVRKDLSSIVDLFGKYLYKINHIKICEYNKMGNRIANQRNKYAHGNLSKDFDELSSLDIYFLKMIVYTMQMKKMNIPDKNIKDAISNLFFSGFIITTESKEI